MVAKNMTRKNIPKETSKHIIKKKAVRVSDDAGEELSDYLEQTAFEIGRVAVDIMRNENKSNLKPYHIHEAIKKYFNKKSYKKQ